MLKKDVQKLAHGLYKIYWKTGSYSLASVGSKPNGDRWMAPINWVSVDSVGMKEWKQVEKVKVIKLP